VASRPNVFRIKHRQKSEDRSQSANKRPPIIPPVCRSASFRIRFAGNRLVVVASAHRALASDGVPNALLLTFSLDATHGIVIKEACIARTALEVPEPPHG